MVVLALALVGVAIYGLTRMPTAFLPVEDQGYLIVPAQLPDGASKERTDAVMQKIAKIAGAIPGVDHVVTVSGISILDNRASLANAGVAFVVLKDWDVRLKAQGQDARTINQRLNGALQGVPEAFAFALPPPPIQGIGNVGGFTMQVELKNGNFDYALLQSLTNARRRQRQRAVGAAAGRHDLPRRRAAALRRRSTGSRPSGSASRSGRCSPRCRATSAPATSASSTSSATSSRSTPRPSRGYRATADDIRNLKVKAGDGTMTPIGTVVDVTEVQGPPLISLYNLYPSSTVVGGAAPGFSSGQALDIMDQIGEQHAADRDGLRLDRHVVPGEAGRQPDLLRLRLRACCSSISCSPASTRAGSCRSP